MRYTNIARRALALVCTAALAAIPALGLSACGGPSDEELIKQTLTADLDAIKTVDEDTVKSMMGDSAVSEMETYGIDAFAFYTNCVKQFSYDNVDVTVDGDSATATLDVTNVDIEKVLTSWANDVSAYVTSQEAIDDYNNLGENGMMQKMLQQLTDALGASDAPHQDLVHVHRLHEGRRRLGPLRCLAALQPRVRWCRPQRPGQPVASWPAGCRHAQPGSLGPHIRVELKGDSLGRDEGVAVLVGGAGVLEAPR